jgi:hypothetical protein
MYADDTTLSINGKNIFEIEAISKEDLNFVNMCSDKYDSNHFIEFVDIL